jgi:hypothetical protein
MAFMASTFGSIDLEWYDILERQLSEKIGGA